MGKLIVKPKQIEWTEDMINELYKASKSAEYFANEFVYIIHPSMGRIKLNLRDYQERIFKEIIEHPRNILLSSRQLGKCCNYHTKIEIKEKKSNDSRKISIGEFYNLIKK